MPMGILILMRIITYLYILTYSTCHKVSYPY